MEAQTYKVITLGSYGVGKTCILKRATEENFVFTDDYICTIGVDFKTKTYDLDGRSVKLSIWDTAGQERFHHINRYYYKGCHAVILVYDVTNEDSFEKVSSFLDDFKKNGDGNPCVVLVGNKSESNARKISYEQGKKFAEKINAPFLECSAMTGESVEDVFYAILYQIHDKEIQACSEKKIVLVKTAKKKKRCSD